MFMQLNRHTCISNLYDKCASYTILKKKFLWSQQGDGNVHNLCCSLSSEVGKTVGQKSWFTHVKWEVGLRDIFHQESVAVLSKLWQPKMWSRDVAIRLIWGDQVGSASARTLYPEGGGGGACSPIKILKFRGYEIAPETIFGQYDASRRPDDRVSHESHSAHCVVLRWCRFPIQSTIDNTVRTSLLYYLWVHLSAESHTLRRRRLRDYSFACKNEKLLEDTWNSPFALCAVISQVSTW